MPYLWRDHAYSSTPTNLTQPHHMNPTTPPPQTFQEKPRTVQALQWTGSNQADFHVWFTALSLWAVSDKVPDDLQDKFTVTDLPILQIRNLSPYFRTDLIPGEWVVRRSPTRGLSNETFEAMNEQWFRDHYVPTPDHARRRRIH
jgi:hypothetical protein